jgi:hypothetical protein
MNQRGSQGEQLVMHARSIIGREWREKLENERINRIQRYARTGTCSIALFSQESFTYRRSIPRFTRRQHEFLSAFTWTGR